MPSERSAWMPLRRQIPAIPACRWVSPTSPVFCSRVFSSSTQPMAIGERHLSVRVGNDLVNHKTYVVAGDGCLMEGISQEAITLAGHLKLSHLVLHFDDNGVSIDGKVSLADSTDQLGRFVSAGWN